MSILRKAPIALILFISFVFVQSLFFKFTDSAETQYIFGTLNAWAIGLGLPEIFAPNGIASQYVVGTAELIASIALLASLMPRFRAIRPAGALLALGVISGAIFFHLFTPLGVAVIDADGASDGGLLFAMACGVWAAAATLLWLDRDLIRSVIPGSAKRRAMA